MWIEALLFYVDNKKKDILILDEGPTQVLDDTTLKHKIHYPFKCIQLIE